MWTSSPSITAGCATRAGTASSGCTPRTACCTRASGKRANSSTSRGPTLLDAAANEIRRVVEQHGPGAVAVIGGARGTNEDAYLWARLAKGVIGTDNVDAQLGDGLPADVMLGIARAQISDCDRAAAIVMLGSDPKEELPVLYLRLRRVAVELDVPVIDLAPVEHGLSKYASFTARAMPGEGITTAALDEIRRVSETRTGDVVVVLGRGNLAESTAPMVRAAAALASVPRVKFLSGLRRGNVHGALEAGLAPGFLPGRVTLDAARDWYTERWGGAPAARGLDTEGILRAAADGQIHVLVLLGADPLADFPDVALAARGVASAGFVIAVDAFVSRSTERADVFFPCTLWGEKAGTSTNLEGRIQRLGRKLAPEGTAMDDWRIAIELALRLGHDIDLATVDEVADEVAATAPAQLGTTAALLRRARDGVVLPVREHLDEIVVRTRADRTVMGPHAQKRHSQQVLRNLRPVRRCDAQFLREKVPGNWADLCDLVTDNFRVINPKDFRVMT